LLYADAPRAALDLDKILEALAADEHACGFDPIAFTKFITDNWSVIEVLKNIPSIPPFLACSHLSICGASSTELSDRSGGLLALIDGIGMIQQGNADTVLIGAATTFDPCIEPAVYPNTPNEDCGAALVIERLADAEERGATIFASFGKTRMSFSPSMYMNGVQDADSVTFLLQDFADADRCITAVGDRYVGACDGLCKIVEAIERKDGGVTCICILGSNGQNAAVSIAQ
jgi:hypothetical protein